MAESRSHHSNTHACRLKKYTKLAQARHQDVCKAYVKRYMKKRTKAVASNTQPPPTTIEKALNMDEDSARGWLNSILDEWNGLGNLGVLYHSHTLEECKEMGVTTTPVPLSIVLDHKFDEKGELKALKTRLAVRGNTCVQVNITRLTRMPPRRT